MGFLKKLTRPISRVLDKIVPNEIKPALPFLAAAVPFLAPQAGIFGTMAGRAALSGGSNLLAQLAQEGSEGDFSGLSTLLAAGTGALTAGGPGKAIGMDSGAAGDTIVRSEATGAPKFFADKTAGMDPGFTKSGLEALGKGSEYLSGVGETLRTNPFSMEGLKASIVPITQGTTDLAIAEGRRLEKQQAIDDALARAEGLADDADRAAAIRQFMEAAGYFSEDEIAETISAAGYADGGRVGLSMGGDPDFSGIKGAVESVDENMRADRAGDFFRLREEAIMKGDDDKIKEIESDFFKEFGMVMPQMAKDGGLMNLGGKEMDLRKGGFVPIGKKERADDVPARLSKNEFVMTADAVRGAGGGDINKGAKRMYETMNRLEARA